MRHDVKQLARRGRQHKGLWLNNLLVELYGIAFLAVPAVSQCGRIFHEDISVFFHDVFGL